MVSTHTSYLDIPSLPMSAREAHLFPDMQQTNLVSIPKLCDAGCTATFQQQLCTITLHGKTILTGYRCPTTGLWQVPLHNMHQANAMLGTSSTPTMVAYSHAALFSPALSTLTQALHKGYISNFPGLTLAAIKKYPPQSEATSKGHLDQTELTKTLLKQTPNPKINQPLRQSRMCPFQNP